MGSHPIYRRMRFPSSGQSLFTRVSSLFGRGMLHPADASFTHIVSCAQPDCVSAGRACHSSVGREYSPQMTTEHVVTADYRVTKRFSR